MSWNSITLDQSLEKLKNELNNTLNKLNSELSRYTDVLNDIDSKISALQAQLNLAQSLVDSLSQSGIYYIILKPKGGEGWTSRLLTAANVPPTASSYYTTVFASLAVAPYPENLSGTFEAIFNSVKQNLIPPRITPPNFSFDEFADIDYSVPDFDFDKWVSKTLGELFPGMRSGTEQNIAELNRTLQDLQNAKNAVQQNITALQGAILEIQAVLSQMSSAGIYEVFLAPALGSWIDRMQSEPGAPPDLNASTGICIVGIASSLSEAQSIYNSMQEVLKP